VDPATGGPIEGLLRIDEALGDGAEREIVTLDLPDAQYLKDFPITVHALGLRLGDWAKALPGRRFSFSPHLTPWLSANLHRFDTVVVEGLWNYASVGASLVLPGQRTPYFVFPHGMLDPWFRRRYPLKHLAKQVFWWLFEGRLLAGARRVLFTTDQEQRLALGQFHGHRYRSEVVGYGTRAPPPPTPLQISAFRALVPTLAARPYLLFLSRLHEKKGVDVLVEAFARIAPDHPGLDLVVAGPGESGLVQSIRALVTERGLDARVHLPGMVRGDAKWGAMYGCEAFVLVSHQENFGIVVAEALACGRPVLISDQVNICDEVAKGGAGIVDHDTVEGAERMIRSFLAQSDADTRAMATAARTVFRDHFDVQTTARRLADVLAG
jgi:glycosyltransferase involved in cell wall biosynthesis